jgi:hypothetical protein
MSALSITVALEKLSSQMKTGTRNFSTLLEMTATQ